MFHIKNYDCKNTRHIRGALHGLLNIVTLRDKKKKKKTKSLHSQLDQLAPKKYATLTPHHK
jgi:hypothetical protein